MSKFIFDFRWFNFNVLENVMRPVKCPALRARFKQLKLKF